MLHFKFPTLTVFDRFRLNYDNIQVIDHYSDKLRVPRYS